MKWHKLELKSQLNLRRWWAFWHIVVLGEHPEITITMDSNSEPAKMSVIYPPEYVDGVAIERGV